MPARLNAGSLSPLQKAAIFVMYLERDAARALLRNLSDDEIKRVGGAIADLGQVDEEVIETVVSDFVGNLRTVSVLPSTGRDFARKVLPDLVDEGRRDRIAQSLRGQGDGDFEAFVRGRPVRAVAAVLAEEHPQVRAVALLRMGPENAARVLASFPEDEQADLAIRMARAQRVDPELAEEVEAALRRSLADVEDLLPLGGVDSTARILGRMSRERNTVVLDQIRRQGGSLADDLQRRMFSFEDLVCLDSRGVQALLRAVERGDLVTALKGSSSEIRELFLRNLSTRAAQDLREEIELGGPSRRSAVREAQERVVAAARKLADEGAIYLELGDGDEAAG